MTVTVVEFIRRFLLHILPQGFMRIRHFGLFANRDRTEHLNLCRKLLGEYAITKTAIITWYEQILERTGKNPLVCSSCDSGLLQSTTTAKGCGLAEAGIARERQRALSPEVANLPHGYRP